MYINGVLCPLQCERAFTIVADVKLRCKIYLSQGNVTMTATIHSQDVSASPFTLSHTAQIPFYFCAIPYHLIDDDVFPQLKGNHIKLLLVIDRYRNLRSKQKKFDQQLLSGWTIPVSQQVLADRCGVKRPTINNLVEELIGLGLLEKQLDDKPGRYRYRLTAYKVTSELVGASVPRTGVETVKTVTSSCILVKT